jgi:5-methylcytosine-specific restriction endonuclease McrA
MITLGTFSVKSIIPHIGEGKTSIKLRHLTGVQSIKVGTLRLECLRRNQICVVCGLVGNRFVLQEQHNKINGLAGTVPHLNLFHYSNVEPVLMTVDHIIPRSKDVREWQIVENLSTMCSFCNLAKADTLPDNYAEIIREQAAVAWHKYPNIMRKQRMDIDEVIERIGMLGETKQSKRFV